VWHKSYTGHILVYTAVKYAGERIMGGYVSSAGSGYLVKNKEKYVSLIAIN